MKKQLASVALGLGLGLSASVVSADEGNFFKDNLNGDISGGVTFATDIRYDGLAFNSEEGALIGWLEYGFTGPLEGFFFGIWAANQANDDYAMELDYYAGYAGAVGSIDYYLGYMYYDYLGSEAFGSDGEFFAGLDWKAIGLYFEWDGGRDNGANGKGNEFVGKISVSGDLPFGFGGTLAAAAKSQEEGDNYGWYELAVVAPEFKGVEAEISYVGTDSLEGGEETSLIFAVTRGF